MGGLDIINVLTSISVTVLIAIIIYTAVIFFTPKVDCEVSVWGPCDPITGKQIRTIQREAKNGGAVCGSFTQNCPVDCEVSVWGPCTDRFIQNRTIVTLSKNNGAACPSLEQSCIVDISGTWNIHSGGHEGIVSLSKIDNTTWVVNKISGSDNIISGQRVVYKKDIGYIYNDGTTLNFSDNSLSRLTNKDNIGLWLWRQYSQ